jgi:CRISPR/Cas system CSM-associated protein Csm2 small subunit
MAEMGDAFKKAGFGSRGPEKKCEECGKLFVPREPHHRRCSDCVRKSASPRRSPGPKEQGTKERRARGLPVPESYPEYFHSGQTPRPEYLTDLAEAIAVSFGNTWPELTRNQLRAFYAHAKRREASARNGRPWSEVYTELVKMVPIAGERAAKGIIPREFEEFIRRNVERSKDQTAFLEGFIEHFQAVVAYSAGTLKKN